MQEFHFAKTMDKAGPQLFSACALGKHLRSAVLTCRKSGGAPMEFVRVTLNEVLVSSYNTSGSEGHDNGPTEEVSLNFAKITFEYQTQKSDGSSGGWEKSEFDLKQNRAA
jgi:type VI secretion system secreted protein Hcp